jgi:cytoskeletal protein RodZ
VRKSSGYSIAELSARTRIPESVIEDLEQDNFSTCGGAAYARGHIRNIANICGADVENLLSLFESQTIPLNKSIRELLNDNNVTKPKAIKKPLSWKSLAGVLTGLVGLALFGGFIISSSNSPQTNSPTTTVPSSETGPVASRTDGVEVTLLGVNGLSWVAVSDSTGTTLYSGRIRQGESKTFTDNQLIYLVLGNAGAIDLIVNGEKLGTAGEVGEVVRLEFGPQAISQNG